jgi:hypothetical protein
MTKLTNTRLKLAWRRLLFTPLLKDSGYREGQQTAKALTAAASMQP